MYIHNVHVHVHAGIDAWQYAHFKFVKNNSTIREVYTYMYISTQYKQEKKSVLFDFFTWKRSANINILEFLDGLPELDERGHSLPHHHGAIVGPAGVKGEVVEGGVVDPLSEQCSLQSAGHQLLLEQGHTNVKQTTVAHQSNNICHHSILYNGESLV